MAGLVFTRVVLRLTCDIVVVKLYQEESPGIFGSDGGMSRVVSLIEVAASLGTVLGPVIGGFIKETFGYNSMCWSWSESIPFFFFFFFLSRPETSG